jgi:hypothetical protein
MRDAGDEPAFRLPVRLRCTWMLRDGLVVRIVSRILERVRRAALAQSTSSLAGQRRIKTSLLGATGCHVVIHAGDGERGKYAGYRVSDLSE